MFKFITMSTTRPTVVLVALVALRVLPDGQEPLEGLKWALSAQRQQQLFDIEMHWNLLQWQPESLIIALLS